MRHLSPQAECDLSLARFTHVCPPIPFLTSSPLLPPNPHIPFSFFFSFFQLCSSYFINEICVSVSLLDLSEQVNCHSCRVYTAPPPREVGGQSFVFLSLSLSSSLLLRVSGLWELSAQCWCLPADGLRSRVRGQE